MIGAEQADAQLRRAQEDHQHEQVVGLLCQILAELQRLNAPLPTFVPFVQTVTPNYCTCGSSAAQPCPIHGGVLVVWGSTTLTVPENS